MWGDSDIVNEDRGIYTITIKDYTHARMTHEPRPDINTMLSLLQLETHSPSQDDASARTDATEPTKSLGFFDRQRAMWADKVKLTELLETEREKVARLEQDKKELTWTCKRIQMKLDTVHDEFEKLKAEIAKERAANAAKNRTELEANKRSNKLAQERYENRLQAEHEADAQREAKAARRTAEETARRESAEGARPAETYDISNGRYINNWAKYSRCNI